MKKVLFTSHTANFSKFNQPFIKWFHEQGWIIHYASMHEEDISNCDKHFKVQFNRSPYSLDNIKAYHQLKKIINDEEYDIIHCHTPVGGVITRLASIKARKKGTKIIYTAHGFHFYKGAPLFNWIFYYPIEKFLSYFTDTLITINKEDFELVKKKKFKTKFIKKIDGVGINLARFKPAGLHEKIKLREVFGINNTDFVLIYVAEFTKNKNQKSLIFAVNELVKVIPEIKVLFAGIGDTFDNCKELVKSLGLTNVIYFMGYRKDIELLYRMADICVSTSRREGLPINIIESMASGLPVICTNIRGHKDIVESVKNGLLYSINNNLELCNDILCLYLNADVRKMQQINNYHASQKYDESKIIEEMKEIYNLWINI